MSRRTLLTGGAVAGLGAVAGAGLVAAASQDTPVAVADAGGVPTGVLIGLGVFGVILAGLAVYLFVSGRRRSAARA